MQIVKLGKILHVTKTSHHVKSTLKFRYTLGHDKALHWLSIHKSFAQIKSFFPLEKQIFPILKQSFLLYVKQFLPKHISHPSEYNLYGIYLQNKQTYGFMWYQFCFFFHSTRKMHTIVKVYSFASTQCVHILQYVAFFFNPHLLEPRILQENLNLYPSLQA